MSGQSFRFLHSGGFHLQATLQGLADVTEEVRSVLVEAPFTSAGEVFAAAIREEVDFLVLSGDLLDPLSAGPRAIVFLQEKFAELAQRQIPVYWSASELDQSGGLLHTLDWPDNVKIFRSDQVEHLDHRRGELRVAEVVGRSWQADPPGLAPEGLSEQAALFRLSIMPSMVDVGNGVFESDYWAVGGDQAGTPVSGECMIHCPGRPQGFSPTEVGPQGCTLVQASADKQVRTRRIATHAALWQTESLSVTASTSRGEIRGECKRRVQQLASEHDGPVLVNWCLKGADRYDSVLARESERRELLDGLRAEFNPQKCPVWSASLDMESVDSLPDEWFEEDSILGDYLRVVKKYFDEPDKAFELAVETGDDPLPREIVRTLDFSDRRRRSAVLHEAAVMGTDLLRGDERSNSNV